jgi:hypothetical protein
LASVGLVATAFGTGCSVYSRFCLRTDVLTPPAREQVQVTFLGVGGFLIRYQGREGPPVALMTAPLYSNPTFGEIATQAVATDQRLVDALLDRQLGKNPADVAGILAGHSHYDHLMDVPYVAVRWATGADLYGNDAMVKLLDSLRPALKGRRLVSLEAKARDLEAHRCRSEAQCPDGLVDGFEAIGDYIRVWPILSEHSSQFRIPVPFIAKSLLPPAHLWRGDLLEARKDLPSRPSEWVEGTALAYVIDFLDRPGGQIAFRIYYQDSGSRDPFGFPSSCLLKNRPVDLALLCLGGSENLKAHPTEIVKWLRPRFAIASHWEDFFNPRTLPLPEKPCTPANPRGERINGIPLGKPEAFMKKLRAAMPSGSSTSWPCPDTATTFEPGSAGWTVKASTTDWKPKS